MEQGDPPHRVRKRNISMNEPMTVSIELTREYWKNAPPVLSSLLAKTMVQTMQKIMETDASIGCAYV